jgi:hypothetical protein
VEHRVVAEGDLTSLMSVAREVVPGVDDECVVFTTGGAPPREVVVVGREAEVETRCNSILRVAEDVESGDGMDSLPRVGMWG